MNRALATTTFYALIALLMIPSRACCQVTLSLSPASGAGMPGDTIVYQGEIANVGTTAVSLDSLSFSSSSSNPYTTDSTLFFNDTPASLAAGDSYSGDLFSATIGSAAPPGTYDGAVAVIFGDGAGNESPSNFANYLVVVQSAGNGNMPEPPVWLFSLVGVLAGVIAGIRARSASSSRKRLLSRKQESEEEPV